MNCTLDANVLVAASQIGERHHDTSRRVVDQAFADGTEFVCPVLVLPECAAAVARATGQPAEAASMTADIRSLPNLRLAILDEPLAARAAEIAGTHRLRGADSVYVAVAEFFQATLVTWDVEMLERAPAVVPTMTPADWLTQHPATP